MVEVIVMCYVTATELKKNLSYYLEKAQSEDVYVTKNNKVITVMMSPQTKALFEAEEFIKSLKIDRSVTMSDDEILLKALDRR